jgi:adenylate cyclase
MRQRYRSPSGDYGGAVDSDARTWAELGVYDPDAANASDRLATLRYLAECGATNEEITDALAADLLTALAGNLARRRVDRISLRQVAERADIDLELAQRLMRTAGLGEPEPDDPLFFEEDIETFRIFNLGVTVFGVESTLQFVRVAGAALATIADAAMTNFGRGAAPRLDAEAASELVRAQTGDMASRVLFNDVPTVLTNLFIHHADAAIRRSQAAGSLDTSDLTVAFLDLVGSTALAEGLTADGLGAVMSEFEQHATQLVSAADGRVVKMLGDEVMFVSTDAAAACVVALDLADWVEQHPVLGRLHGGLAAGDLVRGYGDYYGPLVNTAARATKVAEPGSILVTAAVRDRVSNPALTFESVGEHQLRGIDAAVELFRLKRT